MVEKQMIVYFVVYFIANFIALLFSSKILNGFYCNTLKVFLFSIVFTAAQMALDYFLKLNIIYTILLYPIIYIALLYTLMGITKLIKIMEFGSVLKTSLILVLFQVILKSFLFVRLAKVLNLN